MPIYEGINYEVHPLHKKLPVRWDTKQELEKAGIHPKTYQRLAMIGLPHKEQNYFRDDTVKLKNGDIGYIKEIVTVQCDDINHDFVRLWVKKLPKNSHLLTFEESAKRVVVKPQEIESSVMVSVALNAGQSNAYLLSADKKTLEWNRQRLIRRREAQIVVLNRREQEAAELRVKNAQLRIQNETLAKLHSQLSEQLGRANHAIHEVSNGTKVITNATRKYRIKGKVKTKTLEDVYGKFDTQIQKVLESDICENPFVFAKGTQCVSHQQQAQLTLPSLTAEGVMVTQCVPNQTKKLNKKRKLDFFEDARPEKKRRTGE